MRVVIETNVLVSFLTDREPKQHAQASELFSASANGDHQELTQRAAGVVND